MKQTETEFIELLKRKAEEARLVEESGILPDWAGFLGRWLGERPWRLIGLVAFLGYGLGRWLGGVEFREVVLKIFGGG